MELLKWAQAICLHLEKSVSTDRVKHRAGRDTANHLRDFGGQACVRSATRKKSLGSEQYWEKSNQTNRARLESLEEQAMAGNLGLGLWTLLKLL